MLNELVRIVIAFLGDLLSYALNTFDGFVFIHSALREATQDVEKICDRFVAQAIPTLLNTCISRAVNSLLLDEYLHPTATSVSHSHPQAYTNCATGERLRPRRTEGIAP